MIYLQSRLNLEKVNPQTVAWVVDCVGKEVDQLPSCFKLKHKTLIATYLQLVRTHRLFPGMAILVPTHEVSPEYIALLAVQYHPEHPIESDWVIGSIRSLVGECDRLGLSSVSIPKIQSRDMSWEAMLPYIQAILAPNSTCSFYLSTDSMINEGLDPSVLTSEVNFPDVTNFA